MFSCLTNSETDLSSWEWRGCKYCQKCP